LYIESLGDSLGRDKERQRRCVFLRHGRDI
jgi:hypothetical protein